LALALAGWQTSAFAQRAPAPDSAYYFRDLTEQRAEARSAEDRSFYEKLLSANFQNRAAFIDDEVAADPAGTHGKSLAVRNFSLVEHRPGFVVTSYLLTDGTTGHWFRDVYQVEDGKWRLASVTAATPVTASQAP
jgi:hypothetical protein